MKFASRVAALVLVALSLPTAVMAEGSLAKPPATALQLDITGKPGAVAAGTIDIETGKYYRLTITSDGGDEVLFTAPGFFDAIYLNQIVVNDAEIKMFGTGIKGLEVGENIANKVDITFVAIKPGDFPFMLNGTDAGMLHVH